MIGGIQVVVPMAGLGTRFSQAGYTTPKPLLPINGRPMFELVLYNMVTDQVASVTVIAQAEWGLAPHLDAIAARIQRPVHLIEIDYVTEGPAATVELARPHLDPDLAVVTGNSDQHVHADLRPYYALFDDPTVQGSILTMEDNHPKWSYAAIDDSGDVTLVREKEVISRYATVGIYGFRSARLMFGAFDTMRGLDDRVNGEFYVAPSYNHLIAAGARVVTFDLGPISEVMHGLGTPEDYEAFLRSAAHSELPADYWNPRPDGVSSRDR